MFKPTSRRRPRAALFAGLAVLAATVAPLGVTAASADSPQQTVTSTATPTTGLVDGQSVAVHVTSVPPGNPTSTIIYSAEARLCKGGANVANDSEFLPTEGSNCTAHPVSPGTSSRVLPVSSEAPNTSVDLTFIAGTGTDTFTNDDGAPVTITCDHLNPCTLVLKLQVPSATEFKSFPLTYAGPQLEVPGAPTSVTAVPGNQSAQVSWMAPASDGGAPISDYTVTASPGGATCATTGVLTCNVGGLTNGTPYTFTVTAENSEGPGDPSAASAPVTPFVITEPGAPTGVTASAGILRATVNWTAPASNGGAPITAYHVVATPGGGTCSTTGALTCDVTNMTAGTPYTFVVTATNPIGAGPASAPSTAVVPFTDPTLATHLSVVAPGTATNGTPVNVTVTALDKDEHTSTSYSGPANLTSTDASASMPSTVTFVDGVATFSATLATNGSQTITATDATTDSITGTSAPITVVPAPATHLVVAASATATAGTATMVTVTAKDAAEGTATAYSGTVHLTSGDSGASLPANAVLTEGVGTFPVTFTTAGSQTVAATDTVTASITGSDSVLVSSGPASSLEISAPTTATTGTPVSVTVNVFDAFDNQAFTYGGTVEFASTDPTATLPADVLLVGGTGTFPVTFTTVGNQTVTVTDTASATLTATSATIAVSEPAPTAGVDKDPVTAGDTFTVTGTGFDPEEAVEVWLHSDPVLLGKAVADAAGAVSLVVMVPADTPVGTHHIELVGTTSAVAVSTADFAVAAAVVQPTSTTTSTVAPSSTTTVVTNGTGTTSDAVVTSSGASSGSLPVTGSSVGGLVALAGALLGLGVALVAVVRRRGAHSTARLR